MRIIDWSSDVCSSDLAARVYLRPTCFVDRPHESGEDCLRIADTMVWFTAWHVSLRDDGAVQSAVVPVPELDGWIAAMPGRLAEGATAQRAGVTRRIGRACCRESVCMDGVITLVAVT